MVDPESYDWSKFELTYYYNAPLSRVFRTWTECRGLESFFIARSMYSKNSILRADDDLPQTGDDYNWEFRQGFSVDGTVITLTPEEQFTFSFGQMQVDVYFRAFNGQTEVHLIQSRIPDTADGKVFGHLNCRSCWIFFMTNLTSILDYDKDLRDGNPDLVSSMEVGFIPMTQRYLDSD